MLIVEAKSESKSPNPPVPKVLQLQLPILLFRNGALATFSCKSSVAVRSFFEYKFV